MDNVNADANINQNNDILVETEEQRCIREANEATIRQDHLHQQYLDAMEADQVPPPVPARAPRIEEKVPVWAKNLVKDFVALKATVAAHKPGVPSAAVAPEEPRSSISSIPRKWTSATTSNVTLQNNCCSKGKLTTVWNPSLALVKVIRLQGHPLSSIGGKQAYLRTMVLAVERAQQALHK